MDTNKIISVMIVDDHPLFRESIRNVILEQSDMKVVREASSGEEAVKLAINLTPDIIVMDISLPGITGIEATKEIRQKCQNTRVLVLTVHNDNEHILAMLEAGAAGYLTKSVSRQELIIAIRAIMAGDSIVPTQVLNRVLKATLEVSSDSMTALPNRVNLNAREDMILKLMAKGMSNKDIAERLILSTPTIKNYLVSIFSKLGASSRTEAVVRALKYGIITSNDLE